ncbi:Leucine zipper, homeobox-associated [Dillenia turbinata]|uniref:Homeobox-leucine zipper protein n=1 Tax=Dillenia turbinata TaxID=194707 RepID=A0AAN8W2I2_9MAGN
MKRYKGSLTALASNNGNTEDDRNNRRIFQDKMEDTSERKKRRLSSHQVMALEKNFEVESTLDADTKLKLARELGLRPCQVAIWFQNRRARSKTKLLEKEFEILKVNHQALKLDYDNLEQDKKTLLAQVNELKAKLKEQSVKNDCSAKEETMDWDAGICDGDPLGARERIHGALKEESNTGFSNCSTLCSFSSVEDQSSFFNTTEDYCNIFCIDQAPSLVHWC